MSEDQVQAEQVETVETVEAKSTYVTPVLTPEQKVAVQNLISERTLKTLVKHIRNSASEFGVPEYVIANTVSGLIHKAVAEAVKAEKVETKVTQPKPKPSKQVVAEDDDAYGEDYDDLGTGEADILDR